jgi:hypothetical protein
VHGDGQDFRIVVEHPLNSVSVVRVSVYVGDSYTRMFLFESGDGYACVVVEAEAAGLGAESVVQPAAYAHCVVCSSRHHRSARSQHRTGDLGSRLVYAGDGWIVRRANTVVKEVFGIPFSEYSLLNLTHVVQGVDREEIGLGRRFGSCEIVAVQESGGFAEFKGHTDSERIERMIRTKSILFELSIVDQYGRAAHSEGGP